MQTHMSDCSLHNVGVPELLGPCDCGLSQREEFEEVVRPVIKWLCENHHPHMSILITPVDAQLLEGVQSTGPIFDYVLD